MDKLDAEFSLEDLSCSLGTSRIRRSSLNPFTAQGIGHLGHTRNFSSESDADSTDALPSCSKGSEEAGRAQETFPLFCDIGMIPSKTPFIASPY